MQEDAVSLVQCKYYCQSGRLVVSLIVLLEAASGGGGLEGRAPDDIMRAKCVIIAGQAEISWK